MSFHIYGHCSPSERDDLERGRTPTTTEDNGVFYSYYPHFSGHRPHASTWKLFGCCALVGLVNVFSTFLTLAVMMNLGTSDIILESNVLLLSTGLLVSLFWRLHCSHCQSMEERYRVNSEHFSRTKLCIVVCLFTVMLSPVVACLPLLVIFWMFGGETFPYDTSGIPLILSWVSINTLAAFLIPSLVLGRATHQQGSLIERHAPLQGDSDDYDAYDNFDETDGPTFLPHPPVSSYHDISGGFLSEEKKAVITFTPTVSWKNTIETSEKLRRLVRWVISVPVESLQPSMVTEMLAIAAISIGVHLDGMGGWSQEVQYRYLVSRTCDRLAEIFQQSHPSAVPDDAANVFLFLNRFEPFDRVDFTVLGSDNAYIPAEELKRIVRCLKSRSAASLGRGGVHLETWKV